MGKAIALAVVDLIERMACFTTVEEMMIELDDAVSALFDLNVVGFLALPQNVQKVIDNPAAYLVVSPRVSREWVDEWEEVSKDGTDLGVVHALTQPMMFTDSELVKTLNPTGVERAAIDLKYKHGIRDRLISNVSGKYIFGYSSKALIDHLDYCDRRMLQVAAGAVCHRHYQLDGDANSKSRSSFGLTNRELAVLRLASVSRTQSSTAKALGLSVDTVKQYLASARKKLGCTTTSGAVATALRNNLIT